jgi:hypothetical protein
MAHPKARLEIAFLSASYVFPKNLLSGPLSHGMSTEIAFVLLSKSATPAPDAVIASAAKLGFTLTRHLGKDGIQQFGLGDGRTLFVTLVEAPHPDGGSMAFGPTSIPEDQVHAAHLIVTAMGLAGTPREIDTQLAALTAAVIDNVPAIGAMLGHGAVFHKAKLFSDLAALGIEQGGIPPELAIDITTERISESRMAFRTFNMPRYGRENFYITCAIRGKGALDFVMGLVRWLITDPTKQLPTGETVGRTATEKVTIHRVKSPEGETHIRLDLP